MTTSPAPAGSSLPLARKVDSSSIPPGALAGSATIASPCIVPPAFLTAKVTLPALTEVVSALTNISPIVALTSAFIAPMSCPVVAAGLGAGATTFGAPVVCRMPAAPLTMSPKAWVTNG